MNPRRHTAPALVLAAAQFICAAAHSPASDSPAAGGEAGLPVLASFPLSDRAMGVRLPVTVARRTMRVLLDTGSLAHFFDDSHRAHLGPQMGTSPSRTPTGMRMSPVFRLPAGAGCGPCDLSGQEAGLFDLSGIAQAGTETLDGTLGLNAMRGYLWYFDFDSGTLEIARSPARGDVSPVPSDTLLNLPVTLPDGRDLPFLLDTGCLAWGTLEAGVFDSLLHAGRLTRLPDVEISTAHSASQVTARGRLASFRFQSEDYPTAVFLRGNANRLGWEFFTRYNWQICLDLAHVTAESRKPRPVSAGTVPPPAIPRGETPDRGLLLYQRACMSCHMADGGGQAGKFPPLRGSDWVASPDPARLIRIVLHGMMGPVSINGKPFFSSAPFMPGHASSLTDSEVADLLTWVRREMADQSAAVPPEAVARARAAESKRNQMWRERELLDIPLTNP